MSLGLQRNSYRIPKLKLLKRKSGNAVQIADEQGPIKICAMENGQFKCAPVAPR